jgi:hypothetical protein
MKNLIDTLLPEDIYLYIDKLKHEQIFCKVVDDILHRNYDLTSKMLVERECVYLCKVDKYLKI